MASDLAPKPFRHGGGALKIEAEAKAWIAEIQNETRRRLEEIGASLENRPRTAAELFTMSTSLRDNLSFPLLSDRPPIVRYLVQTFR